MADVQVWRIPLEGDDGAVRRAKALLPADEQDRAERFLMPHLHDRWVLAHAGLRSILGEVVGASPSALRFELGPHGKPSLPGKGAPHFNLSHSHTEALLAVCADRVVGVDIERVRPDAATEAVAATVFSTRERKALASADDPVTTFFRTWVAKEAYIKAHGRGLSMPLHQFDIAVAPGQPLSIAATRDGAGDGSRWWIEALDTEAGYFGALVVARHTGDDRPAVVRRTIVPR